MFVKSLELNNFRNYNDLSIELSENTNIFYGDNAQGKTNILEAIYLASTTKSHKGSKDREIIKLDKDESHIRMILSRDGIDHRIDMHLKKNKPKGVAIDGLPIKKSADLFGIVNVVSFSPEDLSIIKSGPSERRRFIDMELCQLDKIYLHNLINYNKVLNQRNNLLKQLVFKQNLLDTIYVWDEQLITFGKKLIETRELFIKKLNEIVVEIHKKLSSGKETLTVSYEPNVSFDDFSNKLQTSLQRDIALKVTNYGPHRDDLSFKINDVDIRKFGSQGQQRTSALSLKLAEIEMVKNTINDNPILLLDDVLSELDRNRQTELLSSIDNIQTIVTCTGMEEFVNSRIQTEKVFQVTNGTVKEQIDICGKKAGG
ncbi:DNA replication/repair protein RecF [Clostridium sp. Marseille-P299]|uniref:DNA replication/repair protein RecF n=1 Tax=Clostridium sp. Marseille-P299 TaxID=1805477 RepID=UPI00082ACC93|nr:DNA replication/repair protein RecF [Clostridium sp. Marseille-P299]